MKLKSLEIKGFKSFADKTQVLLDHPITGIVGPNGCGKSNIVDAIRWVIGEHKIKALRSEHLEDLIFNGSKTRAGSGMAEVSLTFENTRNLLPTDFTTVTITRKFYKSGESEYRLNDVTCRLKDIHNLFLDTGVSNDSYAIIELGMVDDIIKDKEGARRRMLEQAAGISIYKTRKKEAKLKLDATEADLARIEDLLFEIANNLRTLESQARKAERYFSIKGEYKEVSVELAKASLEHFNEQYKTLTAQSETETDRRAALEAHVATEEAGIEKEKVALIGKEQSLNGLQKAYNDLVARIRELESTKKLAAQRLEHLRERESHLRTTISGATRQLETLENAITTASEGIARETVVLDEVRKALEAIRESVDQKREAFDARKTELDAARASVQKAQHRRFDAEKKVAVADSTVQNIERSIRQVAEEAAARSGQIDALQKERAATEEQHTSKSLELSGLQARQEEVKTAILQSGEELEGLRAKLIDEGRLLDSRRNEHDLLKSLVDSLEGYPDSIKYLAKNKDWGVQAPLLSDVFSVQEGYRTAIEAVLSDYLNYYVVKDVDEAARAVHLLETAKKGKASFLVLSGLPGNEGSALAAVTAGAVSALDVITVDEPYKPLAWHLLSHVFIAEGSDAVENATLSDGRVLVEKNGKMLRGRYTLTGGSVGLFEGAKIGRAKNLERLSKEIGERTEVVTALRNSIAQLQSRIAGFNTELSDKKLESTRQEVARLLGHAGNLAHRSEHFQQLNEGAEKRIDELGASLAGTQQGISATRAELENINAEGAGLLRALEAAETSVAEVERTYAAAREGYNAQNVHYHQQEAKRSGLKQELEYRTTQRAETERQITANTEALEQSQRQIAETETALHSGDTELYDLLKRKELDERALNEADRLYYEVRNALTAKESTLSGKRREKEAAELLLSGIKDKLGEMKLQLSGMKERLSVEFRVNLEEILDQARSGTTPVEDLKAEADRMKKRLENMGEINPTAIEAFTEMKARHDFIVEQKTDLVNAKESLLATIEEVELTANKRFAETFEAVRKNFVEVFQALFTADDAADLRLTDPDNVAESGIEIYAQPKGKKPSTLTQLSGGEKTLTSTAFLFAIYLIKPAPFCILDEVDAPLDDANVGKFTNMIRKFSDNSQFIIVTHNKQTMAAVDVIYGVTMQEPGVSKLVPVDFRSLN